MRKYCLLLALLASPACLAEGQRWYVVNQDGGCAPLAEGHDVLPNLSGNWTPDDLLKVMREHYPDARLAPLLDVKDKKKPGEKKATAKEAPAGEAGDGRQKYYTPANALLLTADEGRVEIKLHNWELCSKLGALPAGPDQWLAAPLPGGDTLADGMEIAGSSWFEVNDENIKDAVGMLKKKGYAGITEGWAASIADRRYMPEPGKHTYLVRGVSTGKAGSHRLVLRDGVLYVIYLSTEPEDNLRYAPLVVNLSDVPDSVVVLHQTSRP